VALVPRKTVLVDEISPQIITEAEARIRASQTLPFARLTSVKLSPKAQDELIAHLVSLGLERTPKTVRVPLAAQIESLVSNGARIARKDVAKRVKGATKTEIDVTLTKLIRQKRIHLVVRTQTEVVVSASELVLGLTEVQQLTKAILTLAKTVQKVQTKGLPKTILREDLDAVLGSSMLIPKFAAPNMSEEIAEQLVVDALRRLESPNIKLVRIAELVRTLESQLPKREVHRVLSKAFERGTIELRPDGGSEFLKPEDAALCLPGPRGTIFSYARRISP
jgi:hypothetical protein